METHEERRKYARVQLCAYGINKTCTGVQGQVRCPMELVDISSGGARLKLKTKLPLSSKGLVLSVHGVNDGGRLQNLSAQVRWRTDQEVGVQFDVKLDLTVSELQRLIS